MRVALATLALVLALAPAARAAHFGPWGPETAVDQLNLPGIQDGCPIESPDGLSLYLASNRPRFAGDLRTDLDIWVAHRESVGDPWGAPENLGEPVNSASDDFCPTPIPGRGLFFVSRKVTPGVTCGMGDIYFTREHPRSGWREPEHLGCDSAGGPNTALDEQGPSHFGSQLYYSSGPDIYVSRQGPGGSFGVGVAVAELNSAAPDVQPNVRKDGREIVFASARKAGFGQDIWTSTRAGVDEPWSEPVNLGDAVNTTANETRPSLSRDGTRLYFGRGPAPAGPADIHVSRRAR